MHSDQIITTIALILALIIIPAIIINAGLH